MRRILKEVRSGRFARQWIRENAEGRPNYRKLLEGDLAHPIEKVGAQLRARMPWLNEARAPAARPKARRALKARATRATRRPVAARGGGTRRAGVAAAAR